MMRELLRCRRRPAVGGAAGTPLSPVGYGNMAPMLPPDSATRARAHTHTHTHTHIRTHTYAHTHTRTHTRTHTHHTFFSNREHASHSVTRRPFTLSHHYILHSFTPFMPAYPHGVILYTTIYTRVVYRERVGETHARTRTYVTHSLLDADDRAAPLHQGNHVLWGSCDAFAARRVWRCAAPPDSAISQNKSSNCYHMHSSIDPRTHTMCA